MTVYNDFVEVTIDGTDLSDYVITYARNESICEPGQLFTLTMTRKKPDDSLIDIEVSDSVVIREKYTGGFNKVLQGFVTKVAIDAEKALMTVSGADKYIMLADYFIPQRVETHGETVAYWIEYICNQAGLSVQFDSTPYNATQGAGEAEGTPLGMQSALEAIKTLERKGTVYTRYDSDADKIVVYRLQSSQPEVNINSSNLLTIDRGESGKNTRNVVKVWGGYRYDWTTGEELMYSATARANIPELPVDQTVVVASNEIKSFTFANIVAQRVLAINADLDDIVISECAGLYPDVKIGDWVYISIDQGEFSYTRERQVSSIGISVNQDGARTTFTAGEKCPRISVSPPPVPIYVTDTKNGVGVSWNAGDSFQLSNTGLTTSDQLHGKSIAVNNYGRQMVVTAGGLHKRWSGLSTWTQVTNLPDPTNESNDPSPLGITDLEMIKVVDEPLKPYTFHMIASGGHPSGWYRSYVFTTQDYGYTWDTTQMWVPALSGSVSDPYYQEHATAPSGKVFDVWTHDMTAAMSNEVFVLVSSPYTPLVEKTPLTIWYMRVISNNIFRVYHHDGTTETIEHSISTGNYARFMQLFTLPTDQDREICYMAGMTTDGSTYPTYVGSHTYLSRTNDGGDNWSDVHDQAFLDTSTDDPLVNCVGCAFDESSTSSSIRVVYWQISQTSTQSSNNKYQVNARFVTSDPNGSTSYNDTYLEIEVDEPTLEGDETWDGFIINYLNDSRPATKFNRGNGYAFGGVGLYGAIFDSVPSRVGTGFCESIFKFDFGSESISELASDTWRNTSSASAAPGVRVGPAASSSSVWAIGNTGTYTNSYCLWTGSGPGSEDLTVDWFYDIDSADSNGFLGYQTVLDSPYDYELYNTGGSNLGDTGTFDLSRGTTIYYNPPYIAMFPGAKTYYGGANSSYGGSPTGFVYTTNGLNFTQLWSGNFESLEIELRTFEDE
jgi:hypothetical protein